MMWAWSVRRSSIALQSRALGILVVHSEKGKFVVTTTAGTEWNLCFGLFHSNRDDEGFMVPDFSRVQVKKLAEPLKKNSYGQYLLELLTRDE